MKDTEVEETTKTGKETFYAEELGALDGAIIRVHENTVTIFVSRPYQVFGTGQHLAEAARSALDQVAEKS